MTKTFSSTLVATELLLLELLGPERAAPVSRPSSARADDAQAAIAAAESLVEPLAASLRDAGHLFVTGGGLGYPAALEAALKLKEMALIHAEGAEVVGDDLGRRHDARAGRGRHRAGARRPGPPGAIADLLAHAAAWGAPDDRGRAGARLVASSDLLPLPPRAEEDHAPLVRCRRSPCSRSRSPGYAAQIPTTRAGSSATTARASPTSSVPATETSVMTRIVLVGAGSVEFTRNLLGDILSFPALRDAELVLHDIDADRLRTAERMAAWTAEALGAAPSISAHLDRREALAGADFVINTIQVGGARATQVDFDIPARHGLRYTINDTINVGGVLRGLRTIPVVLGIAARYGGRVPRRAVPQLHEPDGHARPGRRRGASASRPWACATPSTGPSTASRATSGVPRRRGRRTVGRRQPPRLDPAPRAPWPGPLPGPRGVRGGRPGPR